jgi:hypothetical protein
MEGRVFPEVFPDSGITWVLAGRECFRCSRGQVLGCFPASSRLADATMSAHVLA